MKNLTLAPALTPLTANDLATIFGGSDDVIDPLTLLGDDSLIGEDIENL